jgi:hypothetical protein
MQHEKNSRQFPGSAYVVQAVKIKEHLPKEKQEKYQELLNDGDTEAIPDWLTENWPDLWPCFESVYCPADEDTVDGETMEQGEIYVLFGEEDLYVKTPTDELKVMNKAGINPQFSRFSVWG